MSVNVWDENKNALEYHTARLYVAFHTFFDINFRSSYVSTYCIKEILVCDQYYVIFKM